MVVLELFVAVCTADVLFEVGPCELEGLGRPGVSDAPESTHGTQDLFSVSEIRFAYLHYCAVGAVGVRVYINRKRKRR